METIHPNDIQEIDTDTISLITLKNGNMIMIDSTAPEKPKSEKKINIESRIDNNKIPQPLSISEKLTVTFKGKENSIQKDSEISKSSTSKENRQDKIIVKSDFNLISQIIKNTNFSYSGIPKQNLVNNNISNMQFDKKWNHQIIPNDKAEISNTNNSINNFSPIQSSNANIKIIPNPDLLNSQNQNNYEENNTSFNKIINSKNEENKEDPHDINARIRRKSRNYLDKIEKLIGDRNRPTVNAVISLNIPSDVTREISATQKQFNLLVTQLRQKQNKYRRNKGEINYQRYYELYKDKNSRIYNGGFGPNINRIKYYQEAEMEDLENELILSGKDNNFKKSLNTKNNQIMNNTCNNIYDGGFKNINKSTIFDMTKGNNDNHLNKTMYSFHDNKNRASSENKSYSTKFVGNSLGYSSALVYPSNRFISKLDPFYRSYA